MKHTTDAIIQSTKQWVWSFIIELNLCPFAKKEWVNDKIRYCVVPGSEPDSLTQTLQQECERLDRQPDIATTLVIFPDMLKDFHDYNAYLDNADSVIEQGDWVGIYQIASFHPDYQFAGTLVDDVENYTNRSPFPMLHLIREADVENAVAHHPDPDSIPQRNIELMNEMGINKVIARLQHCLIVDNQGDTL